MPSRPKPRRPKRAPKSSGVKPQRAPSDNSSGTAGGFELSELRQLIRLVRRTGIGELEVTSGGRTVRIAAQTGGVSVSAASASSPAAPKPGTEAVVPSAEDRLVAIKSPMVGTFYRAPAPDADRYVEIGDVVSVGQTVCIVEAMKLMNEIESELEGRIMKILVENAQPVEYGQALFLVDPK